MANKELFAAVWKVKPGTSAGLSLIEKGVLITDAMTQSFEFMKKMCLEMKATDPIYLFAAPEYYWVKNQVGEKITLYDEGEKDTIYRAMQQTSSQLKNLIVFPGTVNWAVASDAHTGPATAKTRDLVGYNAAPVYLDGVSLLNYYKKFNDNMLDNEQNGAATFGPGAPTGVQNFSAKGLDIGLDICGDLNDGKLSQSLAGRKVDVMVLISGTMSHFFNEGKLNTIPVKDGGAFVHADNSGLTEKNGLWVITPGRGWHGTHRDENSLSFEDLNNKKRTIGLPKGESVKGTTMTLSAIAGFGPAPDLQAAGVETRKSYVTKFTFDLTGSGRTQTALVEKPRGEDYRITISRKWSSNKVISNIKLKGADYAAVVATGRGNASKIGKLLPGPSNTDLECFSVPIVT